MEHPPIRHVTLVPKVDGGPPGGPRVKRYSLAGLGPARRSALGEDRHERLEQLARRGPNPG